MTDVFCVFENGDIESADRLMYIFAKEEDAAYLVEGHNDKLIHEQREHYEKLAKDMGEEEFKRRYLDGKTLDDKILSDVHGWLGYHYERREIQ